MPNITSTPSASSARRMASEPSMRVIRGDSFREFGRAWAAKTEQNKDAGRPRVGRPVADRGRSSATVGSRPGTPRNLRKGSHNLLEVLGVGTGGGELGDHGVGEGAGVGCGHLFGNCDRALQRSAGRAGAETLAEEERGGEERAGGVGDPEARDLVRVADLRREETGTGRGEPGARNRAQAAGEVGGSVDDRAREMV